MCWHAAAGTEQMLKGLRSFMSWTHPQVTVSEAESASDLPAYEVRGRAGFDHLHYSCLMFCAILSAHASQSQNQRINQIFQQSLA